MNPTYDIGRSLLHGIDEEAIQGVLLSLQEMSPHIGRYIVEVFGQLFSDPALTYAQRELVIISALISLGDCPNQLKWHIGFGLKAGLMPEEAVEIATHCIPFCGFPRALNAIGAAKQVFAERGIEVRVEDELEDHVQARRERGLKKLEEIDGEHGEAVVQSLQTMAPRLVEQIVEFTFGEIYSRSVLDAKQRQLVTIAALTAQGGCEPQLQVHLNAAIRVGLTEQQVMEALLQCAPYVGIPKTINAVHVARNVFMT